MRERERTVYKERELREHCGLAGIFVHPEDAPKINPAGLVFTMTRNMDNRGQEGFGMVGVTPERKIVSYYQLGRDWQEIPRDQLEQLNQCRLLIAHNRYPTKGSVGGIETLQPFTDNRLILAHNGEVFNLDKLRQRISQAILSSKIDSDSAILFDVILNSPGLGDNPESLLYDPIDEKIIEGVSHARGAFSLILGTADGALYAVRDPWGIRPLCFGRIGNQGKSWALASETVALEKIKTEKIQTFIPGLFWKFTQEGMVPLAAFYSPEGEHFCSFEAIYFSRPESYYFVGKEAFRMKQSRMMAGRILAKKDLKRGWTASDTVVVPINRSGYWVSKGYSEESGLLLVDALPRNPEVGSGRIFIQNTPEERKAMVRRKHTLRPELLQGYKRVVLGEDSIVRGDTIVEIIRMIREGAEVEEVHVRVGSPPPIDACRIGIDTEVWELIARKYHGDWETIAAAIGADSVVYLTVEELKDSLVLDKEGLSKEGFCIDCFTGVRFFPQLMEKVKA